MSYQVLEVYVTRDCPGCSRARAIAQEVSVRIRNVCVNVVEVRDGEKLPAQVFSVPTYLLNGRVISLGNPDLNDLITTLARRSREG